MPLTTHYPYLNNGGTHDLLTAINSSVPRFLPEDVRADVCQDALLAILSGGASLEQLRSGGISELVRTHRRMFPTKYGPLSLDQPLRGTDGLRLIDCLAAAE